MVLVVWLCAAPTTFALGYLALVLDDLEAFDAGERAAGVVAVRALRAFGPFCAELAVAAAIVAALHRGGPLEHGPRWVSALSFAAPALAPLAAFVGIAAAVAYLSVFRGGLGPAVESVWRYVVVADVLHGVMLAAVEAVPLAAAVAFSRVLLRGDEARRWVKTALMAAAVLIFRVAISAVRNW